MDRDRDRDRRFPLDIPPEDQYGTGRGQSYRPGGARERSPQPRADTYRTRSPPRRNDYGGDSYRRRSPSPRFRERDARVGGDSYRGRPRSPPRRDDPPRNDLFRRDVGRDRDFREERSYRDERDRDERDRNYATRSPLPRQRDRSPLPLKRGREPSPYDVRDRRSPLPKRERLESPPRGRYNDHPASRGHSPPTRRHSPDPRDRRQSPRREFRRGSRSPTSLPLRNDRAEPRDADERRKPPSPSPQRYSRQQDYYSTEENGDHSVATSRRSSPPIHPSRMQHADDRSGRPTPRDPYDSRDSYRARSPEPRHLMSPPQTRERDYGADPDYAAGDDRSATLPSRSEDPPASRPPPTGPSGYRAPSTSVVPPTGPSAAPTSLPVHPRPAAAPPSGPRGAAGVGRGDFAAPRGRGGYRGDFAANRGGFAAPPLRGGRGGATPASGYGARGGYSTGGRSESYDRDSEMSTTPTGPSNPGGIPPSGPRGSFSQAAPPPFSRGHSSNNMTTATYPRTQRFAPNGQPIAESSSTNTSTTPTGPRASRRPTESVADRGPHPALLDLARPIDGGQRFEPLVDMSKLHKLQEEAERLRSIINEKETRKRAAVREWDRLSRDTELATLRSQMTEEALRKGNGDIYSEGAF